MLSIEIWQDSKKFLFKKFKILSVNSYTKKFKIIE